LRHRCLRLDALLCFPGTAIWTKEAFFDPARPAKVLNIYDMAKAAGQEHLYDTVYVQANDSVHATPMALAVRATGNQNDAARTLVAAHLALVYLLLVVDDFLALESKARIEELHQEMERIVRTIRS